MLIDIKYKPGDEVKFKHCGYVYEDHDCTFCGGSGIIRGLDGETIECPICDGAGKYTTESLEDLIHTGRIEKIEIRMSQGKPNVFYIMNGWGWGYTPIPEDAIISEKEVDCLWK